jgi:hypothetical protein
MLNKQLPPFKRGDEVIDDNAEIGYILEEYIDATWDAAGNLRNWHTTMRYRWDQPSYGKTRVVSEGEVSLLTQRALDLPHGGLLCEVVVDEEGGTKIYPIESANQ